MSASRFSLDSNLLVYAFDFRYPAKQAVAEQIVRIAAMCDGMVGLQAVGEFYAVTTRKTILPRIDAGREALACLAPFPTFPAREEEHRIAAREAVGGRFSYWDAVLVASAVRAGCTTILSEDMHDGARLGDIAVRNPFDPAGGSSAAASAALVP